MSVDVSLERAGAASVGGDGGGDERPLLELVGVTKTYPSQPPVTALRDANVRIAAGELVGVVGPSGSGKTTLVQVMGTLDRPTGGTVRITGLDVAGLSDRHLAALRATRIGFVFQQFFLAEHATALDNVADGLLYGGVGPRERRQQAFDALRQVGLADRAGSRPNHCPAGNASGWRSPGPWWAAPRSCWPTNLPATSTAPPARPSSASSTNCTNKGPPSS